MKRTGKRKTAAWVGACMGAGIGLGIIIAGVAFTSALVLNETIGESAVGIVLLCIIAISQFMGSLIAKITVQEQKAVACWGAGGIVLACMFIAHFIFFPGGLQHVVGTIMACVIGSGFAFIVGNARKRNGYKRVKKYRFV